MKTENLLLWEVYYFGVDDRLGEIKSTWTVRAKDESEARKAFFRKFPVTYTIISIYHW